MSNQIYPIKTKRGKIDREIRSTKLPNALRRFTFCAVQVNRKTVVMLGIAKIQNPLASLNSNLEKMEQLKLKQKVPSPRSSPELDDSGLTLEVKFSVSATISKRILLTDEQRL